MRPQIPEDDVAQHLSTQERLRRLEQAILLPVDDVAIVSAFENSWVPYDADRQVGYYRDRGRTYLTGVIKSGTLNTTAFTLPHEYWPRVGGSAQLVFAVDSNNAHGSLFVYADGRVVPATGSNVYFGLEVSFIHA